MICLANLIPSDPTPLLFSIYNLKFNLHLPASASSAINAIRDPLHKLRHQSQLKTGLETAGADSGLTYQRFQEY